MQSELRGEKCDERNGGVAGAVVAKMQVESMGLKLIVVCGLALMM